jgi:hypothetical protein
MDKVTFKSRTTSHAEVRPLVDAGGNKFVFTSYPVRVIKSVYIFDTESTKLIKLASSKYSILPTNPSIILLTGVTYPSTFNGAVSIDYEHDVSYNVIDMPHEFRSAFIDNENGKNTEYYLPVQAVARRSHLVLGVATNYDGNNLLDNSNL